MKRALVAVVAAPFVAEATRLVWRIANNWFDAWFIEQLRKAWRPGPR